jgi:hypothetical protein
MDAVHACENDSVIYKYEIPVMHGAFTLKLPEGSIILDFQHQPSLKKLVIWCLVHRSVMDIERTFYLMFTGETFDKGNYEYVGTTQDDQLRYAFHLFEKK